MHTLLKIIKNRWFIAAIGLLAIALVIWVAGPLLGFAGRAPLASGFSRLLTILGIVALWGLNQLRRYLVARHNNQEMLEGVAGTPEPEQPEDLAAKESAEEVETLEQRFGEAIAILKKSRLGGKQNRQYLYQLPWYVIIGPPGSGKTTALLNSGLHFPLSDQLGKGAVRGIGGTRNCDWWFTDDAVLLDTAGRYTTQDSYEAVDQAAWSGFLDLLKKHRRRRPINGVLIAISVADLLAQNERERETHATAIRQRIQELYERFGIRFPIYVLFTKSDLIAGFTEFFEPLGKEERKQVWGMTFPLEDTKEPRSAVSHFKAEFDALEKRIDQRLLHRLEQERDIRRKSLIYSFPQQLSAFRDVADYFLDKVFSPSRYQETPLLRGIYLTSGTQEGTPIDRLLGSMAEGFGLDRQIAPAFSGIGRSYFLTRLFNDVVFPESHLAGFNPRVERQRLWLQRGAYGGTVLLTLLAALAWFTSYSRNDNYIETVATQAQATTKQIRDLAPNERSLTATLPALASVRDLPGGYADRDSSPPLSMTLGLYQGDKLGSEAENAYFRALENLFLPRIMFKLEEQLRQAGNNPDYLYEALKVYLMLNDPEHFDPDTIRSWMSLHWQLELGGRDNAATRQALASHLDALLQQMPLAPPIPLDQQLIARVRSDLARIPLAQRIYSRLKRLNLSGPVPTFRLGKVLGPDGERVFERKSGKSLDDGISGLFTYEGYYQVFLKDEPTLSRRLLEEKWILGPRLEKQLRNADLVKLNSEVRRLYLQEYIRVWDQLLDDIRIVRFNNLQQTVTVLNILSAPNSPLRRLLEAAADQTTLDRLPTGTPPLVQQAEKKLAGITDKLRRLLEVNPAAAEDKESSTKGNRVDRHFAALHRQVRGEGDAPAPIQHTLALLNELYVHMSSIAAAGNQGTRAFNAAREESTGSGSVAGRIKLQAQRQPEPLRDLLTSIAENSTGLTLSGVRSHLNAMWRSRILPFFRTSLAGRYPLDRRSTREATLEDFGKFFGPGGLMDDFFDNYLKDFVDRSHAAWRWTAAGNRTLGIPNAVLRQFQRAARIRDAFFRGGERQPEIRFDLKPMYMDTTITQFTLLLDGQKVGYAHGPTRWKHLKWPEPGGNGEVQILLSPPAGDKPSSVREDGPWSWFRILDRSRIETTDSPEKLQITFAVGGRTATFVLRASSAVNPFRLKQLELFRCPNRL